MKNENINCYAIRFVTHIHIPFSNGLNILKLIPNQLCIIYKI